jgi:hypothetical protein
MTAETAWVTIAFCYLFYLAGVLTGYMSAKHRADTTPKWGEPLSHVRPKSRPFDYERDA